MNTNSTNGHGSGHGTQHDVVGRTGQGVQTGIPSVEMDTAMANRWPAAISLAMEIGQGEARLPAVPTPDWLDRAAEMVAPIATPGFGIVGLVTENRGRVPMFDAVGLGSSTSHASFESGKVHARPLASRSIPGDLRDDISSARIVELRAPTADADWVGPLSELMVADWTATSFGRAFLDNGLGHVTAGLTHLGMPSEHGRRLLVLVASAYAGDAEIVHALLSSSLHSLRERATMALGASGPTRWLTEREHEVLEHLTEGKSVREIAEQMNRSPHTVHDHVKALHRKLHASSRGELVALALGCPPAESVVAEASLDHAAVGVDSELKSPAHLAPSTH